LELWPYQRDVDARLEACIAAGRRRPLIAMATGAGKTVVIAVVINDWVQRGARVLFLAHRHELITQASAKLLAAGVHDHAILKAGFPPRLMAPLQVGSVQTIHARAFRTKKIELGAFDLVVIDEAHHARARTYQQIVDAFPNAVIIGLTATPCRGDGLGLGNIFNALIEGPSVEELIREGRLVGTRVFAPVRPDVADGIKTQQGDYVVGQLASRMNTDALVGDIILHWHRHGADRRTVCFAVDVKHSLHIRDEFRRAGVLAEHIDGTTPLEERTAILAKLSAGEIGVVSNCMVLTEGWDQPAVSCLVLARPTRQLGLFRQMVGRVLRPAPGKDVAIILDHSGATFRHGFAEDPIAWTLDQDERAVNKRHVARFAEPHHRGLVECPKCSAVRVEGQACGSCDWKPTPKPRHVDFEDGDLGEVKRDRSVLAAPIDELRFFRELKGILIEKRQRNPSIKPGYPAAKFKEKFGRWPPDHWRNVDPLPPSTTIRAWVRSRDIAYAKAMQARR
jgi:DNA repair protein RadD